MEKKSQHFFLLLDQRIFAKHQCLAHASGGGVRDMVRHWRTPERYLLFGHGRYEFRSRAPRLGRIPEQHLSGDRCCTKLLRRVAESYPGSYSEFRATIDSNYETHLLFQTRKEYNFFFHNRKAKKSATLCYNGFLEVEAGAIPILLPSAITQRFGKRGN